MAQRLKYLPAKQETWVRSLGREDPLEKGMATHFSILAWRIPWTEEPGGLQWGHKQLDTAEINKYWILHRKLLDLTQFSCYHLLFQFSSVQSLSRVQLFATPWNTAHQASLSLTNSQSLSKLISIESVMPFNHLILCYPLLLPPSIFPSIRDFSNESFLRIRWLKLQHQFFQWIFRTHFL